MPRPSSLRFTLGLLLGLSLVGGCVRVQPHQRETLTRPSMRQDELPLRATLDGHIWEYREGSIGGTGVGVGGCGCH